METKEATLKAGKIILRRIGQVEAKIRKLLDDLGEETGLNISAVDISFMDASTFEARNGKILNQVTITITE